MTDKEFMDMINKIIESRKKDNGKEKKKKFYNLYTIWKREERKRKMGEFYKMIWIKNKKKGFKKLKKKDVDK